MGRTNRTFRDTLRAFEDDWQPFRRALRRQYEADFDRLIDGADQFADAAGFQAPTDTDHAILLSMLLAQQVELRQLRERVAALDDDTDGVQD